MGWIVEVIDPGCGCCSFVPVGEYRTEKEAQAIVDSGHGYTMYKQEEYEGEAE